MTFPVCPTSQRRASGSAIRGALSRGTRGRGRLLKAALALGLLTTGAGCTFEASDVDGWQNVQNGLPRLAGYLSDGTRPIELRMRAARGLFAKDQVDYIMAVVAQADAEQRAILLPKLADLAQETLKDADRKVANRGTALAYYLLEYGTDAQRSALGASTGPLAEAMATAALDRIPPSDSATVSPQKALLGAIMAHPPTIEMVLKATEAAAVDPAGERRFLALLDYLGALREPAIETMRAELLLTRARALYPDISDALAQAMLANRNPTLLKFLIELTRDPALPERVRGVGFAAMSQLGKAAIPNMMRVVRTNFPTPDDARYLALRGLWEAGGPAHLGPALRALPTEGKWPSEGTEFRDDIDAFCDNRVATKAAEAKPVLIELLDDPNWIARAYALRCITRLYPNEAADLVGILAEDLTPLPGWQESGEPSSFAEAVKALTEG